VVTNQKPIIIIIIIIINEQINVAFSPKTTRTLTYKKEEKKQKNEKTTYSADRENCLYLSLQT